MDSKLVMSISDTCSQSPGRILSSAATATSADDDAGGRVEYQSLCAWKKTSSREHWHSVVDMAMLKKSMP